MHAQVQVFCRLFTKRNVLCRLFTKRPSTLEVFFFLTGKGKDKFLPEIYSALKDKIKYDCGNWGLDTTLQVKLNKNVKKLIKTKSS